VLPRLVLLLLLLPLSNLPVRFGSDGLVVIGVLGVGGELLLLCLQPPLVQVVAVLVLATLVGVSPREISTNIPR
jgi:hypothetical protein